MPRKKPNYHPNHPIHITARCINRDWFRLPVNSVWNIFTSYLDVLPYAFNVEILCFVLMNNHFHLLVLDPDSKVSEAMNYFMRETSRAITLDSQRVNQTYGGPFHPTVITKYEHLLAVYKYILRNPVDAKKVERVEEYKYSTLSGVLGFTQLKIQISELHEELFEVIKDTDQALQWLNTPIENNKKQAIKMGLRRANFRVSPGRSRERIDLGEV